MKNNRGGDLLDWLALIFILGILFFFASSCSRHVISLRGLEPLENIRIETPDGIEVGPDFESAAAFCDSRYLPNVDDAESCFQDYRDFFSLKLSLDIGAIVDFCSENYSNDVSTEECIDDLRSIFDNVLNREEQSE